MAYLAPGGGNRSAADASRLSDRGVRHFESALKGTPDSARTEMEKAVECFRRSLAIQPENPEVFYHLGFACFMLLDFVENDSERIDLADQAIKRFKQLLKLSADDAHILDLTGGVLFRRGGLAKTVEERLAYFDEAIAHLNRLIATDTDDPESHGKALVSLALCYAHRGANSPDEEKLPRFEAAVRHFEQAIELDAVDFSMRYNYANALLDVGKNSAEPVEKARWFNRSLSVHEDAMAELDRATASESNQITDDIAFALETGTAADFRYNYACLLSLMQQTDRAVSVLRGILAEDAGRIIDIKEDIDFDPIRDAAEFQKLIGSDTN